MLCLICVGNNALHYNNSQNNSLLAKLLLQLIHSSFMHCVSSFPSLLLPHVPSPHTPPSPLSPLHFPLNPYLHLSPLSLCSPPLPPHSTPLFSPLTLPPLHSLLSPVSGTRVCLCTWSLAAFFPLGEQVQCMLNSRPVTQAVMIVINRR